MATLVWGTWDLVLPAQHARVAVNRLPHGRPALFRACGHLPHVEQPERFVAELQALLGVRPTGRRGRVGREPSAAGS
jgi:pimeloyl-ACP methyl ester carboxylesterase